MLTTAEAALVARADEQTIHTLLKAERFHWMEKADALLICLNSLIEWKEGDSQ
jgi:hypothetical protein